MNRLVILAAGSNERFGGNDKIFANINNKTNLENTYEKAKNVFDEIYLVTSSKRYNEYENLKSIPSEIKLHHAPSGKGDLLSLLFALQNIEDAKDDDIITVCWGDAVFVSDVPFNELIKNYTDEYDTYVAVSLDEHPYAWFDVDDNYTVIDSHYKKDSGDIEVGIHDQSLFGFRIKTIKSIFDFIDSFDFNEYKTLNYFYWLSGQDNYKNAKCIKITSGNVYSFNTEEELNEIVCSM